LEESYLKASKQEIFEYTIIKKTSHNSVQAP
jgi:hypothetical protein